jgi:methyl-accepting chemotaxis protein
MEAVNASMAMEKTEPVGQGFTVMAQEVEMLAEESRRTTAQAEAMLKEIQKATGEAAEATERESRMVEAGVRQAMAAEESAERLVEGMTEVTRALEQVVAQSVQQLTEMDRMVSAIDELKRMGERNLATTQEAERAAHHLHDREQKLKHLVED